MKKEFNYQKALNRQKFLTKLFILITLAAILIIGYVFASINQLAKAEYTITYPELRAVGYE